VLYLNQLTQSGEDKESMREHLERAVSCAGQHWHSAPLWNIYIDFEKNGEPDVVVSLYERAMAVATKDYHRSAGVLKAELQAFVAETLPEELITIMVKAEEQMREVKKEVEERAVFEDGLSDDYVSKVTDAEHKVWTEYLDYISAKDPSGDMRWIFGRYVNRCHYIPEAWCRYGSWMARSHLENKADLLEMLLGLARDFLGVNRRVYTCWAELQEYLGFFSEALALLKLVGTIHPEAKSDMLARMANLEQRRGNRPRTCELFEEAMEAGWEVSTAQGVAVAIRYAYYLMVLGPDGEDALRVLDLALCHQPMTVILATDTELFGYIRNQPKIQDL
jgi:hypothetical protein